MELLSWVLDDFLASVISGGIIHFANTNPSVQDNSSDEHFVLYHVANEIYNSGSGSLNEISEKQRPTFAYFVKDSYVQLFASIEKQVITLAQNSLVVFLLEKSRVAIHRRDDSL